MSYWFDLPIDVAEFEEKLGVGAESRDYRIIEKVSVVTGKKRSQRLHMKSIS